MHPRLELAQRQGRGAGGRRKPAHHPLCWHLGPSLLLGEALQSRRGREGAVANGGCTERGARFCQTLVLAGIWRQAVASEGR